MVFNYSSFFKFQGSSENNSGTNSPSGLANASTKERKFFNFSALSSFGSPANGAKNNSSNNSSVNNGGFAAQGRNSKRSRSLIRRSSKKVKQQVNQVGNPEDCVVS